MKEWRQEGEKLKLYFTPFFSEEIMLTEVYQGESGDWYYNSETLGENEVWIAEEEVCEHDLKLEMEEVIYSYFEDERNYYQELMDRFIEGGK